MNFHPKKKCWTSENERTKIEIESISWKRETERKKNEEEEEVQGKRHHSFDMHSTQHPLAFFQAFHHLLHHSRTLLSYMIIYILPHDISDASHYHFSSCSLLYCQSVLSVGCITYFSGTTNIYIYVCVCVCLRFNCPWFLYGYLFRFGFISFHFKLQILSRVLYAWMKCGVLLLRKCII